MDKKPPKIVAQINKGNNTKMREMMGAIDLKQELELSDDKDINSLWNVFTEKYYNIEKDCIPTKTVYIDGKRSKKFTSPLDRKTLLKIKKKK